MKQVSKQTPLLIVNNACDSRKCQHLYLRGNFQQDICFDKVDKINIWNRLWLSAKATGVIILSFKILNNHFHINGIFQDDAQRTDFKHHFRLSITQYHNRRYQVNGTLGTRTLKHGIIKDTDDLKDCICYHIRNILHHGISQDYLNYPFSTALYVFNLATNTQKGIYTRINLPDNLAKAYLPLRERLPHGWQMTAEGLIIPPTEVFRRDIVEALFGDCETYLEQLTQRTNREASECDEPKVDNYASHSRKNTTPDEEIEEFIKENCHIPIQSMNTNQKTEAIHQIRYEYPKASMKLLARLFGIPYTTLRYRLKCLQSRE